MNYEKVKIIAEALPLTSLFVAIEKSKTDAPGITGILEDIYTRRSLSQPLPSPTVKIDPALIRTLEMGADAIASHGGGGEFSNLESVQAWRKAYHLAKSQVVNAFFAGIFLGVIVVTMAVYFVFEVMK